MERNEKKNSSFSCFCLLSIKTNFLAFCILKYRRNVFMGGQKTELETRIQLAALSNVLFDALKNFRVKSNETSDRKEREA